jgi:hypothetical protein
MPAHVAGPAVTTVPTESTTETILREARIQNNKAAEARVGGRKRDGDAKLTRPTAKV